MSRIALFLPTLDDGGAERVMLQLGKSFAARGHQVDLVVAVPGGPLESQIPPSVRRVDLAARRSLQGLPPLARYLRREKPRALLSTLEHSNLLAVWARFLSLSGVRVVLREANVVLPEVHGWKARVERLLMRGFYRAASAIVAVSQSVAESLVRGLGLVAAADPHHLQPGGDRRHRPAGRGAAASMIRGSPGRSSWEWAAWRRRRISRR